jgi:hypothetical protein
MNPLFYSVPLPLFALNLPRGLVAMLDALLGMVNIGVLVLLLLLLLLLRLQASCSTVGFTRL